MQSNTATIKQRLTEWILATLRESAWAPLGVIGFYLAGLAFDWFDLFPPLDIPTHFMGGIAITYFYRAAIHHSQKIVGEIPLPVQVLLGFTCTGTTIVFWEFYENSLDFLFHAHNVLGVADTVKDMFFGLFGALVLTLFYRRGETT